MNKIIILLSCVLTSERKPPAIGGSNYYSKGQAGLDMNLRKQLVSKAIHWRDLTKSKIRYTSQCCMNSTPLE